MNLKTVENIINAQKKALMTDVSQWASYLETAAHHYKHPIYYQLMINVYMPEAKACCFRHMWNDLNHSVSSENVQNGIPVNFKGKLEYLYDITYTGIQVDKVSKAPWIWSIEDKAFNISYEDSVNKALSVKYDLKSETFFDNLYELAYNKTADYLYDSNLEYSKLVAESAAYSIMSRCCPDKAGLSMMNISCLHKYPFDDVARDTNLIIVDIMREVEHLCKAERNNFIESRRKNNDIQRRENNRWNTPRKEWEQMDTGNNVRQVLDDMDSGRTLKEHGISSRFGQEADSGRDNTGNERGSIQTVRRISSGDERTSENNGIYGGGIRPDTTGGRTQILQNSTGILERDTRRGNTDGKSSWEVHNTSQGVSYESSAGRIHADERIQQTELSSSRNKQKSTRDAGNADRTNEGRQSGVPESPGRSELHGNSTSDGNVYKGSGRSDTEGDNLRLKVAEYGYFYAGMNLIENKLTALKEFDNGNAVYLLYPDNTEGEANSRDEIENFEGYFGLDAGIKSRENKYEIFGNAIYRYIPDKSYRKLDSETALKIAVQLNKIGVKFSGKIAGEKTTLTISKNDLDKFNDIAKEITTDNSDITQQDIDILRTLEPRKSILNFTAEEIEYTKKWQQRFESDINKKSPYYRAVNGDWRENDKTTISIANVINNNPTFEKVRDDIKNGTIPRGAVINSDTNWHIQISRKGLEDSVHYANKHADTATMNTMYHIQDLLQSAILLDSTITDDNNSNKANNTAFMHKLYNICRIDNELYLVKFAAEEFLNGKENTLKRMYNVQDIKIEPLRHVEFTDYNQLAQSVLNGSDISISDLFRIVKSSDKDFYLNKRFDEKEFAIGKSDTKSISLTATKHGAFYEFYGEEAKIAANELDLFIFKREKQPACGIPEHAFKQVVSKLEEKGYTISVNDNTSKFFDKEKFANGELDNVLPEEHKRFLKTEETLINPDTEKSHEDSQETEKNLYVYDYTEAEQLSLFDDEELVSPVSKSNKNIAISNIAPTDDMIDYVLKCGGNEPKSLERIIAQFQKGKSIEENAEFLCKEFGTDGRGYKYSDISSFLLSAWFDSDGITIAISNTAFPEGKNTHIDWNEVEKRIEKLLENGKYCSQEVIDDAYENELKDISSKIWYLKKDCTTEYFIQPEMFEGGYSDSVKRIENSLKNKTMLPEYIDGLEKLIEQYKRDKNVLRFHYHKPEELLKNLKDLQNERIVFTAEPDFIFEPEYFITEDEKDKLLTRGSGVSGGKFRIEKFFKEKHTEKEKIDFLKKEYGDGGYGRLGFNEYHDSKGIRYTKGTLLSPDCETFMKWNEVFRRIERLISEDKYITQHDIDMRIKDAKYTLEHKDTDSDMDKPVIDAVKKLPEEHKNVTITCDWSESFAFEEGKTYTVAEFDKIMAEADAERHNGWKAGIEKYGYDEIWREQDEDSYYKYLGYEKTGFTVNLPNGDKIKERQDIGDGIGGVIDLFRRISSLQQYVPILEAQRDLNNAIRERDELQAIHNEMEKEHTNISSVSENVKKKNFTITDNTIVEGGAKSKFKDNVNAITTLKMLESENRYATPEEQEILSRYVGWGGLSLAFDKTKPEWRNEYAQLKDLLNDEEYEFARGSVLRTCSHRKNVI